MQRQRRGSVWGLCWRTVLIALLAPAAPLMTLAVFDAVVRDGVSESLAALAGVGGLAVMFELILRRERSAAAADVGVRAASALASAWFADLLSRDGAPAQLTHYRALRRLRRVLSGSVVTAALDAPFTPLYIAALLFFAGPVGLAALLAVALHAVAALALYPYARRTRHRGARAREALRMALEESAGKRATLDELGMSAPWAARVESLAVDVASRRREEGVADAAVDTAAHGIAALSVIAALWIGAGMAIEGRLTIGGVMAATMIVWRCIAPMETVLRAWVDLRFALTAARAARRTRPQATRTSHLPAHSVQGGIALRGLVVAGESGGAPALRGVSLDIAPGEIVAVCGPAGAGKTALLLAILGQKRPLSGTVSADGRDLRSVDPLAYRTQVAWAPQRTTLFHGTVAQNIRLLAPGADEATMEAALARAGVRLPHPQLPDGVETRLHSGGGHVDESLRTKIMLAGLYAKDARLLLLDDPGAFLDSDGDRALLEALAGLRGRATVLLATNRPSHMRACDRIVRLDHGMIVSDGAAALVLGR